MLHFLGATGIRINEIQGKKRGPEVTRIEAEAGLIPVRPCGKYTCMIANIMGIK